MPEPTHVEKRRIVVEYEIKIPASPPRDLQAEDRVMDEEVSRSLRRILRREGLRR